MRIKQSKLIGYKHDTAYARFINNKHVLVFVYSKPCYCVNIVTTDLNNKESRQCYPLTKEEYDIYMAHKNVKKQMELIAKGGKIYGMHNS